MQGSWKTLARASTLGLATAAAVVLACTSAASTQQQGTEPPARAQASTPAPAPAPSARTAVGDFRHQFSTVVKKVGPSVVTITVENLVDAPDMGSRNPFEGSPFERFFGPRNMPRGRQRQQGMGSGVIVDTHGTILTNNHVVAHADQLKVVLHDDREFRAKMVGNDPKTDLAVIRIDAKGLQPAAFGDSDALQVGEWVLAIGAPFGLRQTVSAGIVSAVGRGRVGIAEYEDFIQTDAAINPGNSGGPLVDLDGRLVGINTAIASRSGGSQGVGFAIPINMAKSVMDQLVDHGSVVRGYLGVMIADLGEELARSFGYRGKDGVLVQDVSADTPAAKAGLRAGDIIIERDGRKVDDVAGFRNAIAQTKPGTTVKLGLWRDGKRTTLDVRLGTLPGEETQKADAAEGDLGLGLGLSDLTPNLRQQFAIEAGSGVVVVQVEPGSPADDAGLRPGDVIVQVGVNGVTGADQARRLLAKGGDTVRLRVIREGSGMFVIVSRK
jgi:serine protease Do